MKRWMYIVPALGFLVIAGFMFSGLQRAKVHAPNELPSALIDKAAPSFNLPPVDSATPGFAPADLAAGHVTVVNFFASWCIPCREEANTLMALSRIPGLSLYGIDYKEREEGAGRRLLNELGNPFSRLLEDRQGLAAIDWGVDGVPETFVIDGNGIIRFKYSAGPLTPEIVQQQLLPEIEKARKAG